jgi:hypothetical protein
MLPVENSVLCQPPRRLMHGGRFFVHDRSYISPNDHTVELDIELLYYINDNPGRG